MSQTHRAVGTGAAGLAGAGPMFSTPTKNNNEITALRTHSSHSQPAYGLGMRLCTLRTWQLMWTDAAFCATLVCVSWLYYMFANYNHISSRELAKWIHAFQISGVLYTYFKQKARSGNMFLLFPQLNYLRYFASILHQK